MSSHAASSSKPGPAAGGPASHPATTNKKGAGIDAKHKGDNLAPAPADSDKDASKGVPVNKIDLRDAFKMLDVENSGTITQSNIKKRLGIFFPNLTPKEYRFMLNNKKEMTLEDLESLLTDNDLSGFDPVEEAFKLYDVNGDGFIDKYRLRDVFAASGLEDMTREDVDILGRAADVDGDGKITLQDFRLMLESADKVLDSHSVQKTW
jgi:calmodulin